MRTLGGLSLHAWTETTEQDHVMRLEVLPPAKQWAGGFFLGCPIGVLLGDSRKTVYRCHVEHLGRYFSCLTTEELLSDALKLLPDSA